MVTMMPYPLTGKTMTEITVRIIAGGRLVRNRVIIADHEQYEKPTTEGGKS
jgi:hypothetical protein